MKVFKRHGRAIWSSQFTDGATRWTFSTTRPRRLIVTIHRWSDKMDIFNDRVTPSDRHNSQIGATRWTFSTTGVTPSDRHNSQMERQDGHFQRHGHAVWSSQFTDRSARWRFQTTPYLGTYVDARACGFCPNWPHAEETKSSSTADRTKIACYRNGRLQVEERRANPAVDSRKKRNSLRDTNDDPRYRHRDQERDWNKGLTRCRRRDQERDWKKGWLTLKKSWQRDWSKGWLTL